MEPEEIKTEIKRQFDELKKELISDAISVKDIGTSSFGHAAGAQFEEWVKSFLKENKWEIYYPNEFLSQIFKKWPKNEGVLWARLQNYWWARLIVSKKQIKQYIDGVEIERYQQEAADLVLFYGDNISENASDVILINVKSHNIDRDSRPPNIISAQRLLEYFHAILSSKNKDQFVRKMNYWFIGVGYKSKNNDGIIKEIHLKDLFKLNAAKIPQINFDAALQIQWHVEDMEEIIQTKQDFMKSLTSIFIQRWNRHIEQKNEKFKTLTEDIIRLLQK